ncbi:hypothetical protein, partial [Lactobacillus johnsonii]|uniref:hypothetical protein n=1 Tax=Lactobacillus johnsonii TaxID=33959 RepID=UPI001B356ADD
PNGLFIFYQVFNLILQSAKEKRLINQRKNRKYFFLIVIYKILLLIKSKNNITLFVFCYSTSKRQG